MGQTTSIMLLPAQSGKTRKATELMNKWNQILEKDGSMDHRHINLIFTSNNKLLSRQTARRVETEVKSGGSSTSSESDFDVDSESDSELDTDDDFNGIDYDVPPVKNPRTLLWISGGRRPKDEQDIYFDVRKKGLENIICCTNKVRIQRAITLMNYLSDDRDCPDLRGRTVNIWIDEADACMKLWTKHIHHIARWGGFVHKIVLISATMGPVVKYFDKHHLTCNLRVFRSTHADVYVKFSECEVHHEHSRDRGQKPREHLCEVLDHVEIPPHSRWFCPGAISKKSHEEIMEELLLRGFNVLILNGTQKEIVFSGPDGRSPVNLMETMKEDDLELSATLRKLYYDLHLYEKPFAVTGNLCVSRGITFASKEGDQEFLFTHGIIPHIGTAEEIYQMVSRCLGNFRHFDTYAPTKLYMSRIVASKIRNQEHLAVELARRYFHHEDSPPTITISLREYMEISQEQPIVRNRRTRVARSQERVPLIIPFGPDQIYLYSLTKDNKIRRDPVIACLLSLIGDKPEYARLLAILRHPNTSFYTTAPKREETTARNQETSYDKKIVKLMDAASRGVTYTLDMTKEEKASGKNKVSVFIDIYEKRLCITVWSTQEDLY